MSAHAGAWSFGQDDDIAEEATGGGKEPIKWIVVEKTMGFLAAKLSANYLQHEGIPARAWQEGAGAAIGLTVGILGTGFVGVPEEYEAQARAILEEIANAPIEWETDEDAEED